MRQKFISLCALALSLTTTMYAKDGTDSISQVKLDEVVVSTIRANKNAPIAFNSFDEKDLKKENAVKSVPYLLQTLPSVVSYSEDGSGVGNTSMRIRGVDASRINVTLNGMPLNNPESQEVYWVDFPDISNDLQSMQVQRGVGTSSNGTAAMGGSISLKTAGAKAKPYGETSGSLGSYNTYLYHISAGTGILKNGLSLDARYSQVRGDGYIRNGKVDHQGIYAALSYYGENDLMRVTYLHGTEHTGITWNGISPEEMAEDRRYNSAGEYTDDDGNTCYYNNETDNYYSDIFQALYSHILNNKLTFNATLSYNHGYGYYEDYKTDRDFESYYGLSAQTVDGVTYSESDAIQRKLMKNDFYCANFYLDYKYKKLNINAGIMASYYDGDNYGRISWLKYNENVSDGYEWYRYDDKKRAYNFFAKASYQITPLLSAFGDLQYRDVNLPVSGLDDDFVTLDIDNHYHFFNPKVGFNYQLDKNKNWGDVYASLSVGNREPLLSDLKESAKGGNTDEIKPERLFDYEFGYRLNKPTYAFNANVYYMNYHDQMVQTGKLNDVGYKLMQNVGKSYRLGIELAASYTPIKQIRLDANATFSESKIKDYTAYFDVYDDNWEVTSQESEYFDKTDICFSPKTIASGVITLMPTEGVTLSMMGKYVGKQFMDNTSNDITSLDSYFFSNIVAGFSHKVKGLGEMELQVYVNNVFDKKYVANGWSDADYESGKKTYWIGYYPQAERNFMTRLSLRF